MKGIHEIIQYLTLPSCDDLTGASKPLDDKEILERAIKTLNINLGNKRHELDSLKELRDNLQTRLDELPKPDFKDLSFGHIDYGDDKFEDV